MKATRRFKKWQVMSSCIYNNWSKPKDVSFDSFHLHIAHKLIAFYTRLTLTHFEGTSYFIMSYLYSILLHLDYIRWVSKTFYDITTLFSLSTNNAFDIPPYINNIFVFLHQQNFFAGRHLMSDVTGLVQSSDSDLLPNLGFMFSIWIKSMLEYTPTYTLSLMHRRL